MAKYNALYLAQKEILNKNLIANVNLTQSLEGANITETSSTSSSESNGKNLFQDSPQDKLVKQILTIKYRHKPIFKNNYWFKWSKI